MSNKHVERLVWGFLVLLFLVFSVPIAIATYEVWLELLASILLTVVGVGAILAAIYFLGYISINWLPSIEELKARISRWKTELQTKI